MAEGRKRGEVVCASFAYIFFGTKRNAERSHFPPSRTKTNKLNLINLLDFFRFEAKCETLAFSPVSNENEYERHTLEGRAKHSVWFSTRGGGRRSIIGLQNLHVGYLTALSLTYLKNFSLITEKITTSYLYDCRCPNNSKRQTLLQSLILGL